MPPEGGGAPRTLVTPLSCEPALAHLDWWCDGRVCQTTASRREEPHCVSCVTCGRRKPTCVCRTRPALLLTVFLPATSSADSSILQHVHNQSLAPPCMHIKTSFFSCRLQNVVGKITKNMRRKHRFSPATLYLERKKTLHSPYLLMRPPVFN